MKVINLYAGPGSGKSTTAAHVFALLKHRGITCEYVQEYAKDKAWEFGSTMKENVTPTVFEAQEYIFANQHFRMRRLGDCDVVVTDSPLLLSHVYMPKNFDLPSLSSMIDEAYNLYDNYNYFIVRSKPYDPKGRFQDLDGAKQKDYEIKEMLRGRGIIPYYVLGNETAAEIIVNHFMKASNATNHSI